MKIKPLIYVVVSLIFLFLIGINVEGNAGSGSYSGSCGNVNLCNVDYTCGNDADGVCPADYGATCNHYDAGCCDRNPDKEEGNVLGCGLCCDMRDCNRCRDLNNDGAINAADGALVISDQINMDSIPGVDGCDVLCVTSQLNEDPIKSGYAGSIDPLCSTESSYCSNEGGACASSCGSGDTTIAGSYDDCTGANTICCDCGPNRGMFNGQCENICNNNDQCEPERGETNANCPNDCQNLPTCTSQSLDLWQDDPHLGQCAPSSACDGNLDFNQGSASEFEDCNSGVCCICGEGRRWDANAGECAPIPLNCDKFNCPTLPRTSTTKLQTFHAWNGNFGNSGTCSTTCDCSAVEDVTSITYTYHYDVDSSASSGDIFTIGGVEQTQGISQTFTRTGESHSISLTSDSTGSYADGNTQWRGAKIIQIECQSDCYGPTWECALDTCAEVSPGIWKEECKSTPVNSAPNPPCSTDSPPSSSTFDEVCPCPENWVVDQVSQCVNGQKTTTYRDTNNCGTTKDKPTNDVTTTGCECSTLCNDLYGTAAIAASCSTDDLSTSCYPGFGTNKAIQLSYNEVTNAYCGSAAESCYCGEINYCDYPSCNADGTLCGDEIQCNWECTEWDEICAAGVLTGTRTCTETNGCRTTNDKPEEFKKERCHVPCELSCDQTLNLGPNSVNDVSVWHYEYNNDQSCSSTCSCPSKANYINVDYVVDLESSDTFTIDGSTPTTSGSKTISGTNEFNLGFTSDSSGSYSDGFTNFEGVKITDVECLDCTEPVYGDCPVPASCTPGSTYSCADISGCGIFPDKQIECPDGVDDCSLCGEWIDSCNADLEQTRDCSAAPSCPTTRPVPVEWSCTDWGSCEVDLSSPTDGYQYRTCTDQSVCSQTPTQDLTRQTADCKIGSCSAFDSCPTLNLGFNNVAVGVYQNSFGRYGNYLNSDSPNPPSQCRVRTSGTDSCSCPTGTTYMAVTYSANMEPNDDFYIDNIERTGSQTLTLPGRTHRFRVKTDSSGSYADGFTNYDGAIITQIICLTDTPTFGDPTEDDPFVDEGEGIDTQPADPTEVIVGVELV